MVLAAMLTSGWTSADTAPSWLVLANAILGTTGVILGAIACWRLERRTRANAPRDYTPDNLPAELMT